MSHDLQLMQRRQLYITDVVAVERFDEEEIEVCLQDEQLQLYGRHLHIEALDLDAGTLTASGTFETIQYAKKKTKKNWLEKLRR